MASSDHHGNPTASEITDKPMDEQTTRVVNVAELHFLTPVKRPKRAPTTSGSKLRFNII